MSEPKFTEGQWAAIEMTEEVSDRPGVWMVASGNLSICDLDVPPRRTEKSNPNYDKGLDELRGNAYLIAAAPKMYEELEDILTGLKSGRYSDTDKEREAIDAITTVLAKARGE